VSTDAAGSTGIAEPATDPRLTAAVETAREAARTEAGESPVGVHVDAQVEPLGDAVTHLFEAELPGYRGWHWAVTVASGGLEHPVTVSEVVLLPGPDALVAPDWVPWTERVRAGDLGVGDLLPTDPDDPRLVPGYLADEDLAGGELTPELGLGRARVLSREGRLDLAERWREGERGPDSPMARGAPASCVTCGFYLPLAGALSAAFGACGNELAPADSQVVHAEYGCGAHSEVDVDTSATIPVAELVYDDAELDVQTTPDAGEPDTGEPDAGA
jgi:hypothetical protein